jgi:MoaA/NifB/PqqE/SkfB family radical SAM enzyme
MTLISLDSLVVVAPKPIRVMPNSLYIEPISSCNLRCKMCYTNVINGADRQMLDAATVLEFTRRFVAQAAGQVWVYWCGTGEVFLHRDFRVYRGRVDPDDSDQRHRAPAARVRLARTAGLLRLH